MIERPDLTSASGLRPLSAIVVVAVVVLAVMVRVTVLAFDDRLGRLELKVLHESGMEPAYNIEDRGGAPLAVFLERLDLVMSPRSMWQAHTPDYMAVRLSEVLGPAFPADALLPAMLPDAREGVIRVERWEIDRETAHRVDDWIRGEGDWEREQPGPLPGIGWESDAEGDPVLVWNPVELLSRDTRVRFGRTENPLRWTRALADGLGETLFGALPESASDRDVRDRRREVWAGLMPTQFARVATSVPAEAALPLSHLLREEGVEPIQMSPRATREREYPSGDFPVLGQWGFIDEGQVAPVAYGGLEELCDRILSSDEWSWIERRPDSYSYRRERPARLRLRPYYMGRVEGTGAPTVRVTVDIALQRMLRERLVRVMDEHQPAVAMAIAVELASGDVLAVDGIHAYGTAAFAPVKHLFMPGSTFKLVTMATALEAGVVHPHDEFEVGTGEWVLRVDGRSRVIHEAEGSKHGRIRAEECLAHSVNAGMVQIGLQVEDTYFHDHLLRLGYGRRTEAGLGGEESGSIPSPPWSTRFAHASVCYGYEVATTLWQHMQALTTILRGGVFKELRVADSIAHGGERYELSRGEDRRVYSPETCAVVRGMMELGAEVGTGRDLFRPDLSMGTKTGTAERVDSEVCLHEYGRAAAALTEAGEPVTSKLYRTLRGRRTVHSRCHTSSIVAVGSAPGTSREVAVFVVVDEPLTGGHFGSKVAGPPAMDILVEALGLTRGGLGPTPEIAPGFAPSEVDPGPRMADEAREQPWRARAAY